MAYRIDNRPPRKPEDRFKKIQVVNGTVSTISFPCYYFEILEAEIAHNYHYHDYIGWPAPNYPGHACQRVNGSLRIPDYANRYEYIDVKKMKPIDFKSKYENYDSVKVCFDKEAELATLKLSGQATYTASASFDQIENNVVNVTFGVNDSRLLTMDKPMEYMFNVFVHSPADTLDGIARPERTDSLVRAKLIVTPAFDKPLA